MQSVAVSAGPAAASRVELDKVRERDGNLAKFRKHLRWPRETVQVHFPHPAFAVEGSNDVFDYERKSVGRAPGGTDKIRDAHPVSTTESGLGVSALSAVEPCPHGRSPFGGVDDERSDRLWPQIGVLSENRRCEERGLCCRSSFSVRTFPAASRNSR